MRIPTNHLRCYQILPKKAGASAKAVLLSSTVVRRSLSPCRSRLHFEKQLRDVSQIDDERHKDLLRVFPDMPRVRIRSGRHHAPRGSHTRKYWGDYCSRSVRHGRQQARISVYS